MMMAKGSHKIPELNKEKTESKCKWGLLSIFESCQGRRVSPKLISNGRRRRRPLNQQIIEYPRKSDQLTKFDEECQRFQEHIIPADKQTDNELKSKRESESKLVDEDHLMEYRGKMSRRAHHYNKPEETSLNKVTFAELLRTASPDDNNNNVVVPAMSEDLTRSFSVRKYDSVDVINVRALVDQMFMERRLKDRLNSECKSFSDALEVLSSAKNLRSDKKEREASMGRSADEDSLEISSSVTAQLNDDDDEIVVLKLKCKNQKYTEDVSCRCSSMGYHRSGSSVSGQESDSFSFKKMKKRLKQRFVCPKGPGPFLTCGDSYVLPQSGSSASEGDYGAEIKSCVDPTTKEKLWKRTDLKRLDFQEFNVILEAKRHLSSRLENVSASDNDGTCKRQPRTLGRILLSPERDFRSLSLSLEKESEAFCASAEMRYSPYDHSLPQKQIERHRTCLSPSRPNRKVLDREESSVLIPGTGKESHDTTGESKTVIPKSTRRKVPNNSEAASEVNSSNYTRRDSIISQNDCNSTENSISGSVLEHEESISKASIIQHLDIAETSKYQEEHQSPVSVLELIFNEEANSPPKSTTQRDTQALQPLRLAFEEHVCEQCIEEQDHISPYVQSVLQAACLDWDYLSEIELPPEETELVDESLFDEVEFPLTDHCYFDPKLLFDRINEVLLFLHEVYCCSPPWLASEKPRIRQVELEKVVIDEVMDQAEFFTLPRTERRTLDQLVSKDVRKCRSWLDVRRDTEQIVIEISADVLEESIADFLLGLRVEDDTL